MNKEQAIVHLNQVMAFEEMDAEFNGNEIFSVEEITELFDGEHQGKLILVPKDENGYGLVYTDIDGDDVEFTVVVPSKANFKTIEALYALKG